MQRLLPLIVFCLLPLVILAQNPNSIDSLERSVSSLQGAQKASVLYDLINYYLRADRQKAALFVAEMNALAATDDSRIQAYALLSKGVYLSRNGKLDSAVLLLERAREAAEESHEDRALIRVNAALAHASISSGKPARGLEFLFAALKVIERYPDREMELKLHSNVPWAYLELKQYRKCIEYGKISLRQLDGTGYEWVALYTYNNMAVAYGALGELDSAKILIGKGLKAAEASSDNQSVANAHFILGNIYATSAKYDLAIQQYLEARPYREKVGNPYFIVADLYTISDLYYKRGEFSKGVQAAQEALDIAEKYNLTLKFEGTYLSLAKNYEGLKDFRNASKYYQLYAVAKDSVYKHASAEAIAEMQTRFDTEKKEQQLTLQKAELAHQEVLLERTYLIIAALVISLVLIVVLFMLLRSKARRKQEVLEKERELYVREAQIQASIQSQESERKRFARDLHDGMGQLISALRIALHGVNNESSLNERIEIVSKGENILNEMYREIRSIAFNLMPQTLVQQGLVPALREMSSRINGNGKIVVRVTSFDMPERLMEIQEISLYRIVQEWVNNVMKYADASVIEVQLIRHDEEITVTMEDNGRGFDPQILQHGSGNGWKNISSRLNLIKASIHIDSRTNVQGTTAVVRVPDVLRSEEKTRVMDSTVVSNTH